MSAAPDPTDLAPSRDPAAYGRRPLFTAGFFAWLALCVVCVLGGVAIGRFGLPGLGVKPEASNAAQAAAAPAAPLQPAVAPAAPPVGPATPAAAGETAPPSSAPVPSGVADQALSDRVTRLEASAALRNLAAAQALAAAQLSVGAEGSAPFDQDLAAYARVDPGDPDLAALAALALRGAPSRAALAAALPNAAALAAAAARQPADNASFLDKFWWAIGQVVIVRKVDPAAPGVDGALTRAEAAAAGGDLAGAVQGLDALPPRARAPLADWLAAAERRLAIDRAIASLRARALAALAAPPTAQQAGQPSGPPP